MNELINKESKRLEFICRERSECDGKLDAASSV